MKLRYPIVARLGRPLRIVKYARFSTSEQDASSIVDQFSFCNKFLEENEVTAVEIDEISDEEMSGELLSRPGIDKVRAGLEAKRWDVLLTEESSRLFRNHSACFALVETAVDEEIRVICINDFVDTAEPDWESRLNEAQRHHCEANRFVRLRIARKMRGLWELGAAIGPLRTGYCRRPTTPATATDPAKGPFFDEIDPMWAPKVYELYEMLARDDPPWLVAAWANCIGLPKCSNAKSPIWRDADIVALARHSIYRASDSYRRTVQKRKRRTGKKRAVRSTPEEQWTRDMPRLRIVPDWLWHKANEAISRRKTRQIFARDADHPLTGIPRDSRGPLSEKFICDICGGKMYAEGRNEGGYQCGNAKHGGCWMKATVLRSLTHERLGGAICNHLLGLEGHLDAVVQFSATTWSDDTAIQEKLKCLELEKADHERQCKRLGNAIASLSDGTPPQTLVKMLSDREVGLLLVQAKIDEADYELRNKSGPPTREQIESSIHEAASQLLSFNREAGVLIGRLLEGPIRAVPYQQYGSNKVVLRAEFQLRLAKLLPKDLCKRLQEAGQSLPAELLEPIEVKVDLFKMSGVVEFGLRAYELAEVHGFTPAMIADKLGTTVRIVRDAKVYGRKMHQAGILDPFFRLTQKPQNASRWRYRKNSTTDDQSDAA